MCVPKLELGNELNQTEVQTSIAPKAQREIVISADRLPRCLVPKLQLGNAALEA